jgi:predicted GNAT family acetyltransferase
MGILIRQEVYSEKTEFAKLLALGCFYPGGYTAEQKEQWDFKWECDDLLLLATSDTDPSVCYGGMRMRPFDINRREQTFHFLGICETFIDTSARGMGIAEKLTQRCIDFAKRKGFDGILVIARRSIDGFYRKHGFYGVSSYPEVHITNIDQFERLNPTQNQSEIQILSANGHEDFYSYYQECYMNNFGTIARSREEMRVLMESVVLADKAGSQLLRISIGNQTRGYFVLSDSKVVEICFDMTLGTEFKKSLICSIASYLGTNNLTFAIHPSHKLITCDLGFDTTISNRTCSYGGHLVRVINGESMKAKFIDREKRRVDGISNSAAISQEEISRQYRLDAITAKNDSPLSFEQTLLLLGATSTFNSETSYAKLPMFIPRLDEF